MAIPTESKNGSVTPRPKVLVTEKVSPEGLDLLREDFEVEERKGLSPEELASIIGDYEALIVRSETKATGDLLKQGKNLKVVARAGVGVDNVDVDSATKLGIIVVNSPSGNIRAAAEHTIALLMAVARNVPEASASLKAGRWEKSKFMGVEVKGKTLGIIGLGKVGLNVARCGIGLGMKVIAVDPYASPSVAEANNVTLYLDLRQVLKDSDFLTIHTPLIASTKGMIAAEELSSMKKGTRILNVARGGMIDEKSLLEALESGHIAGAGIDVFTTEPPQQDGTAAKLIAHPKVVATPHLGASTIEAQDNVSRDVCEQVSEILSGGLPRAAVNAPLILPEEYKKLQPFVKLVEKMGHLYTQHYKHSRQTFDLIYEGEISNLTNTKPLYASLVKGLVMSISSTTTVNIVNAAMVARERGIIINEQHSRDPATHSYSSLVTLRARPARASSQDRQAQVPHQEHVISGFCSGSSIFIKRLDRFATSFNPEGTLLICHNYDSPGKIGVVGSLLGRGNVNINYMSVAPVTEEDDELRDSTVPGGEKKNEALMILGIDKEVDKETLDQLAAEQGILDVRMVTL